MFSLRIEPGESPEQRALLIDTHGEVLKELKRRGRYDIRATVTSIEEGEPDGRTASHFPPGSTSQSGSPPTSS